MKTKIFSNFITAKKHNNKGFTLVELIIVVAIIAVLAAVLAPQYIRYVERSRESNDLQVATNLMRAATVAVADPKSELPPGHIVEILWATGDARTDAQDIYSGKLYIRAPQPGFRDSVLSNDGIPGVSDLTALSHFQDLMLGIMGAENVTPDFTGSGATGNIGDAESVAGNSASFCFHIDTSTGDIALARYAIDGDVNVWIDTIGIDAIAAP